MRKILPIILIITALFSSCSAENKTINAKKYIFGQDNQYMYYDAWNGAPLQKVKDGYVYYKSGYLYFADTKNGKAQPLCDKPNCLHENESKNRDDCRAYIGVTESRNIQYFDGDIYYTVSETDEKTHETAHYIRRYDTNSLTIKKSFSSKAIPRTGLLFIEG